MTSAAYITTSWDDGHILDFRIADMLARHGLPGTFYIPREASTGVMPETSVRELSQTFEVAAHTMHHVFLDTADDALADREICESKTWIEQVTGKGCTMFCPPGGKFGARDLALAQGAGFRGLRSVELLSIARPRRHHRLLILPTTLQAHPHSLGAYARNIGKRWALGNLWLYVMHGRSSEWDGLARSLLEVVRRRGGVFHLWGHSWELERTCQWERLDAVLRLLGELRGNIPCVSNGELARLSEQAPSGIQAGIAISGSPMRGA
ncbi:MAG TPA: polysaccharide deacetylase family protein [Tepidisphaeraceae bacterium]|jgi:peptidoglycan/xylan/chitin deacetylase (PgdA/CDA1 family)|nr:polysaccharide deacetylase family protein [Tepidisphaeraceae bacterium]